MAEKIRQKRESGISRIVGVETEEEAGILDFFKRQFEADRKTAVEKERPAELSGLMPVINAHMGEFLRHYGIDAIDIPAKNIHITDQTKLTPQQIEALKQKYKRASGLYILEIQHVLMLIDYVEGKKLAFMQTLIHEMLHLNSFLSFQKLKAGESERAYKLTEKSEDGEERIIFLGPRRVGFRIFARGGEVYFHDIDEAVIAELTMRFDWRYFSQIPELGKEFNRRQEFIKGGSRRYGESEESLRKKIANVESRQEADGKWVATVKGYSCEEERHKLNELIDDLYKKNKPEFQSREAVFNLFAEAVMTGKLSGVARLVKKTYGKGSFRDIGEETKEKE